MDPLFARARRGEWTVLGLAERHTEWRVGAAADAPHYFSWGVSVGVWH